MSDSASRYRLFLLPLALAAGASLVAASWAGLSRLGLSLGSAPVALHGPMMILGFLGTVIALERAVGIGKRWAWAAPILAAVGAVLLLAGRFQVAMVALLLAGVAMAAVYVSALRLSRFPPYLMVEAMGAAAWLVAVGALVAGAAIPSVVPSLAVFLILTILGERIELSRMAPYRSPARERALTVAGPAVVLAAAVAVWDPGLGARLSGVLFVLVGLLSVAGDIARRTVRLGGVTGYMAAAILAGYGWLVFAGLLWAGGGLQAGTPLYDPSLHVIFVGFVLSMIFAHAPVIVPSVARIQLPFRRPWWLALVLLHATLLLRVVGAMVGSTWMRVWGGAGNVVALGLFVVLAAASAIAASRRKVTA